MNIVILASGRGSNAKRIFEVKKNGGLKNVEIKALLSDNPEAAALKIAEDFGIESRFVDTMRKGAFFNPEGTQNYINIIDSYNPDLIVLAGFMRILPVEFVEYYKDKIINLHPSLLPSFKGKHGILDAWNYGVKVSGCTVHYVNAELDAGKIIAQKVVPIEDNDTLESFEEKIHKAEYELLPKVIEDLSQKTQNL